MAYEFDQEAAFEPQTEKYRSIDEANAKSFLVNETSNLQVIGSLHSVGASREILSSKHNGDYSDDVIEEAKRVGRRILVGNVSPKGAPNVYGPSSMNNEERIQNADENIHRFFDSHNINEANVRMLRPERDYKTPLSLVDLDQEVLGLDELGIACPDKAGDFMYTRNPDIVLAARPADCPISFVTAETPDGPVAVLLHLATLGVAHGYIEQAKVALDELGVDWGSVRVQITPGAHADTYKFTESATNPREKFPDQKDMYDVRDSIDAKGEIILGEDDQKLYDYEVELAAYVYEHVIDTWGIDPYQVFADTTNTPSATSGTSSHSRARAAYEIDGDNTRDVFVGIQHR